MRNEDNIDAVIMAANIVSAFVRGNQVRATELPELIETVHTALKRLGEPSAEAARPVTLAPAVSIKKSVTDDHLICLEDGKKFKSLKRHLQTAYGMTPDQYRTKWGLPRDYPMVAPGYAAARSKLAKAMGLGRKAAEVVDLPPAAPAANDADPAPAPKRRGRPAKKTA